MQGTPSSSLGFCCSHEVCTARGVSGHGAAMFLTLYLVIGVPIGVPRMMLPSQTASPQALLYWCSPYAVPSIPYLTQREQTC